METTKRFIRHTRTNVLKLTVEQFSELLDCSVRTVYRWESGSAEPRGTIILKILKLCKEAGYAK